MTHQLPHLPYAKNALEPILSAETLEYHYGRHHKGYVDKLNQLIPGTEFENSSLEEIILRATGPIFNNGAQVWNHSFFWNCLSPEPHPVQGPLKEAIEKQFGSFDTLKTQFTQAANGQFGSGWAWLVKKAKTQTLAIVATPNAENPLRVGDHPLLVCDVWEHAYYIDYRNERPRYTESLWQLMNWDFASQNFLSAHERAA